MTPGLQQLVDQLKHMTEVDMSAVMLIKGLANEMVKANTDAERKAVTDAMQTETQVFADALTVGTQIEGQRSPWRINPPDPKKAFVPTKKAEKKAEPAKKPAAKKVAKKASKK